MVKKFIFILVLIISVIQVFPQSWHAVGHGVGSSTSLSYAVYCIKVVDNNLYVGGSFCTENIGINVPGNGVAKFNGYNWDSLNCSNNIIPFSMDKFIDNDIYFGGSFSDICNNNACYNIAKWDHTNWSKVSTNVPNNTVNSLITFNNEIYIGGDFVSVGSLNVNHVARWDGSQWHDVGGGVWDPLPLSVQALAIYNGELIVAGQFLKAGNDTVYNIAAWNGSQWHALGKGTNDLVWTLYTDTADNLLYAGGNFTYVDDTIPANHIACWDGQKWSGLRDSANDFQDNPYALAITRFDDKIFVGGFNSTNTFLSEWDGTNWSKVQGPYGVIKALSVYKGNLYVGGGFTSVNGDTAIKYIACYGDSCNCSVGIEETQTDKTEYLWQNIPNPFDKTTSIPYYVPPGSKGTMQIVDANGKLLKEYNLLQGKNKLDISLEQLKAGVYYYSVFIDGVKKKTLKMVIQ